MNTDRTILHIDDDIHVTQMVAALLRKHGYQVGALHDPTKALDELTCNKWRVVLLDIDMPGINGLDLLQRIKAQDGGIQVIMLTGLVKLNTVLQSFRWGAEACVFKPLGNMDLLLASLDDTFHKIDRWWNTLEELSQRGRTETATATV